MWVPSPFRSAGLARGFNTVQQGPRQLQNVLARLQARIEEQRMMSLLEVGGGAHQCRAMGGWAWASVGWGAAFSRPTACMSCNVWTLRSCEGGRLLCGCQQGRASDGSAGLTEKAPEVVYRGGPVVVKRVIATAECPVCLCCLAGPAFRCRRSSAMPQSTCKSDSHSTRTPPRCVPPPRSRRLASRTASVHVPPRRQGLLGDAASQAARGIRKQGRVVMALHRLVVQELRSRLWMALLEHTELVTEFRALRAAAAAAARHGSGGALGLAAAAAEVEEQAAGEAEGRQHTGATAAAAGGVGEEGEEDVPGELAGPDAPAAWAGQEGGQREGGGLEGAEQAAAEQGLGSASKAERSAEAGGAAGTATVEAAVGPGSRPAGEGSAGAGGDAAAGGAGQPEAESGSEDGSLPPSPPTTSPRRAAQEEEEGWEVVGDAGSVHKRQGTVSEGWWESN